MKPILIGMNNPHSDDPRFVLYPCPPGCSGWRVWRMCGEPKKRDYLLAFDRRNLWLRKSWNLEKAMRRAPGMWREIQYRKVVVFGRETVKALGLPRTEPLEWQQAPNEVEWCYMPHPSGRCHWYNDPLRLRMASVLLTDLMEEGLSCE